MGPAARPFVVTDAVVLSAVEFGRLGAVRQLLSIIESALASASAQRLLPLTFKMKSWSAWNYQCSV
jgi:hypothetical protein